MFHLNTLPSDLYLYNCLLFKKKIVGTDDRYRFYKHNVRSQLLEVSKIKKKWEKFWSSIQVTVVRYKRQVWYKETLRHSIPVSQSKILLFSFTNCQKASADKSTCCFPREFQIKVFFHNYMYITAYVDNAQWLSIKVEDGAWYCNRRDFLHQ